ncbi:hypothetical protein B0J11DRAFT_586076 [Dendryphion nanum]|uniref:SET domain-containing protein n=1 Tax=Dendryphion nanum TaxID=256645 RepID=A0A9P9D1P6_9PLEO|nr:hypothetical protein B0J11DRAFT_586076 [Dendryphion nanum]
MASRILSVIFALLSVSFMVSASVPRKVLAQQCWHEFPLSRVILQSAHDGSSQLVISTDIPGLAVHPSSDLVDGHEKARIDPSYGPWTHRPICTDVLQTLGTKLCVFTNSSFSNGRGISIFTTPKIAEDFANLPAFQNPTALTERDVNVNSGAWYTQDIASKGVGMLAKKALKFKDRVTGYTPALLAHLESELSTMEREKYFRVAVYQLPDATRDMYLKLATVYGDPRVRVQDIVKANTFQLQLGGQDHLAVFPETSRLNHACAPNAQYHLDPTLLTHIVQATRPIAPGEEITISYTSPLEPTAQRQQHLQNGFHFTCNCPRCAASSATDAKLAQIQTIQNALNDWSTTTKATPKLAEKLLQMYRKEGLEGFLDMPYGFASLAYNAVGDSGKAEKYAELAKEIILIKDGPWTPNLQIWKDMLKDSKAHWSYRRRV